MKVQVKFSTPDALVGIGHQARQQAEAEWEHQAQSLKNEYCGNGEQWIIHRAGQIWNAMEEVISKYVQYRENITIEFDTAFGGTVKVVPAYVKKD